MARVIITLHPNEIVSATAMLVERGVQVSNNKPGLSRLGLVSGEVSGNTLSELRRKLALKQLPGVLEIAEEEVQRTRSSASS